MAEFVSNLDLEQAIVSHDEALLRGRAVDGGTLCFNPNKLGGQYPTVSTEELRYAAMGNYTDLGKLVIGKLIDGEVPIDELDLVTGMAYRDENFPLAPAGKVVTAREITEGIFKGNLSNGLSGSFKDVGMSHLARNTRRVVTNTVEKLLIGGVSTGDTSPAAMKFFRRLSGITVAMFSPSDSQASSPIQNRQMEAYAGENIHNIKVPASFDKITALVDSVRKQPGFEDMGAVNSVNIARIIPQVAFHFGLYLETVGKNIGQKVDVVIPSGNFGDAMSAYIAREMGLPIDKIVLGNTDKNDALHNLVQDGRYDKRESEVTIASAMDIMAPANLERLIFDMVDGDVERMTQFINRHKRAGSVALSEIGLPPTAMREWGFDSGTVSREQIIECIQETYQESAEIIEPHTAVAVAVAKRRRNETDNPQIAYSTAHESKFEDLIEKVLGFRPLRPDHLANLEEEAQANISATQVIEPTEEAIKTILAPLR